MKPPYTTVLCPTDLSPLGDRAVEVAYALAGPSSVVHLLSVNEPPVIVSPLDGTQLQPFGLRPEALDAIEKKAHAHLKARVPADATARGVRTEIHVIHDPNVVGTIVSEAKRRRADVIVMGTHGRTGFGRILMGSVATDVLKSETAPIVLVHDRTAK